MGSVVDKLALGQAFSEYFKFPANCHPNNCFTFIGYPITDAVQS
jgi:hypothetical protein